MSRWKMRNVVRTVEAPSELSKDRLYRWDVLECGHAVKERIPESTGEAIRMAFSGIDKPRQRRCYECVGKRHIPHIKAEAGQPAQGGTDGNQKEDRHHHLAAHPDRG